MNGNIVAVVLPDLDPIHQLGNYQMLGFIAGIVKAAGPAQDLVHLDFVGFLVVLLHFQQDFGFFLLSLRVIGTHSSISKEASMLALNSGVPLANFIPDPRPPGRRRAVLLCLQLSRSAKTAIFEKRIPVIADFPDPPAICFRAAYIQVSRANKLD